MKILKFFDKLEDRIRAKLSRYPILYAFVGGVGVVIFWRGVWHTADLISQVIFSYQQNATIGSSLLHWWDGPVSIVIGSSLLLSTGLFVFDFLGSQEIFSSIKGEKKMVDKTEEELEVEATEMQEIREEIKEISQKLEEIHEDLEKK